MKHKQKSASYFEFACPHFSDHRTQEAKQREKYDSTVLYKEPDFLRDFHEPVRLGLFYFRFNSRSATENRTETKLRKIEKKLRFSVQTETFSPLPTTYEKKCENKKFLRQLTIGFQNPAPFMTTFRKANNSCWAPDSWRAGAANFAYSVVQRIDHLSPDFPTQNAFLKVRVQDMGNGGGSGHG